MIFRNLTASDRLCDEVESQMVILPHPDREWMWGAEHHGRIVGALFTCYGHGIAMPFRIIAERGAPPSWLLGVVRKAAADCRERGITMFIAILSSKFENERKILKMLNDVGGATLAYTGEIAAGPISIFERMAA